MIKNFNKITNSNVKMKLVTLSLVGIVSVTSLMGCSSGKQEIVDQIKEEIDRTKTEKEQTVDTKKVFAPGEHILTVRSGYSNNDIRQHDYHEGYEIIGITSYDHYYYGTQIHILYVNNTTVECTASKNVYGSYEYNQFGTPTVLDKELVKTKSQN